MHICKKPTESQRFYLCTCDFPVILFLLLRLPMRATIFILMAILSVCFT
ncbi:hypothetical protein [Helicobacter sp. UBA3407]|nr:hypothetical protein [Helicobacter sp. UBA3407]